MYFANGNLSEKYTCGETFSFLLSDMKRYHEDTGDYVERTTAKRLRRDINAIVMDYLIQEGYPAAAQKFAVESGLEHPEDETSLTEERVKIRDAIYKGDLQTAIEEINDIDPQVCDIHSSSC